MSAADVPPYVIRARKQIATRHALHRQLRGYASWEHCDTAAHFLIPDGAAARQGDDPRGIAWMPGISHLVPRMIEIECAAVLGWNEEQAREVIERLEGRGQETAAERIATIRARGAK